MKATNKVTTLYFSEVFACYLEYGDTNALEQSEIDKLKAYLETNGVRVKDYLGTLGTLKRHYNRCPVLGLGSTVTGYLFTTPKEAIPTETLQ